MKRMTTKRNKKNQIMTCLYFHLTKIKKKTAKANTRTIKNAN